MKYLFKRVVFFIDVLTVGFCRKEGNDSDLKKSYDTVDKQLFIFPNTDFVHLEFRINLKLPSHQVPTYLLDLLKKIIRITSARTSSIKSRKLMVEKNKCETILFS